MDAVVIPPVIFSRQRQRIFTYIWDNPGCTTKELIEVFYPRNLRGKETMGVHMSMIRTGLEITKYELVGVKIPKRRLLRYKIIEKRTKCQPQLQDWLTPTVKTS
jgi:hypothetical protein